MYKDFFVKTYSLTILLAISVTQLTSCTSRPSKVSESASSDSHQIETQDSLTTEKGLVPFYQITSEQTLNHNFFTIVYDPDLRLAKYVSYDLKSDDLKKKSFKRKDRFREDPNLVKMNLPAVKPSEYLKSGYDKGHLAPSADFSWSEEANDLTFVMSNMVPQKPGLNRDAWRRLEDKVRKWACGEKHITVITGPIIKKNLPKLKSGLIIPEEFFKVVIDQTPPRKFIAFVYHQNDIGDVLHQRTVPLPTIENTTKLSFINFFKSFNPNEKRSPASLDEWKEAKCN